MGVLDLSTLFKKYRQAKNNYVNSQSKTNL